MTLRASALLVVAAFAVHQARYAIAPDPHGDAGHGYLAAAPAVLALLLAVAAGCALRSLALGRLGRSAGVRWLSCSAALLGLHVIQEGAERVLAGAGPLGTGAAIAVPLCLAAGALVALALRRGEAWLATAGEALATVPRALAPWAPAVVLPAPDVARPPLGVLARHLAGRAPPALG